MLFAVHPAHVESVAWISGRKELLSGLFGLLALGQFARGIRPPSPERWRLLVSYGLFWLALASKLTVVLLVAIALLLALVRWWPDTWRSARKTSRQATVVVAPLAAIAAVWLWIGLSVGSETMVRPDPFVGTMNTPTLTAVVGKALRILGYLVGIALFPFRLRLIYDVGQPGVAAWVSALAGAGAVIAGAGGVWALLRRRSILGFGVATFVLLCLPFLQLVPFSTWSYASERFLFLPVFGLAVAAGWALVRYRNRWSYAVMAIIVLAGLSGTFVQAVKWSSVEHLISDTARLSPESANAQLFLITEILLPAGRYAEAEAAAENVRGPIPRYVLTQYVHGSHAAQDGNWDRAVEEASGLEHFIDETQPPFLLMLVGNIAEAQGDDVEAIRRFYQAERSARTRGQLENARHALARVRSRHAAGLEKLHEAMEANPDDPAAEGKLANLELELFLLEKAGARYRSILSRHPSSAPAHYNLGIAYARQGRHADAAVELQIAIEGGLVSATAWNNLGIARRQSGETRLAESAFQQALQLEPAHCHATINLGRLYIARGETDAAQEVFEGAARSICNASYSDLIRLNLERIETSGRR
jgi:Flp pilus assembly protein TadD